MKDFHYKTKCKRCKHLFIHGNLKMDERGVHTRKFCDQCNLEKKREEGRLYQVKRRQDPVYVRKHSIYNRAYYRGIMAPKGWFSNDK